MKEIARAGYIVQTAVVVPGEDHKSVYRNARMSRLIIGVSPGRYLQHISYHRLGQPVFFSQSAKTFINPHDKRILYIINVRSTELA